MKPQTKITSPERWFYLALTTLVFVLYIALTRIEKHNLITLPPPLDKSPLRQNDLSAPSGFYRHYGKRLLDIALSTIGLMVLFPVMVVVAILVRLKLGSPILFTQVRPGLHGKPFTLYKFRTMTDARDAAGNLLPDEIRLTPFGRLLRSTSLDELPELFNVLKGEMSVVGPRPLMMRYISRYTPEQARRMHTPPGITGWAQINGRNAISWEKRFELDVWYINHCSCLLDMKIIFLTFWKVVKREGISEAGHETMSEFMGYSEPPTST